MKVSDIGNISSKKIIYTNDFKTLLQKMVAKMKMQTARGLAQAGPPLGYELVKKKEYGASVRRLIYILKFSKMIIIWEFYFYRPEGEWILLSINNDTRLELLD